MIPLRDTVARRYAPVGVWLLVGLNIAVFLWESTLPPKALEWLAFNFGLVPARYTHPEWAVAHGLDPSLYLPFLTSLFLHGGLAHLIGNLWTLWIFGTAVEDRLGTARFLIFYFGAGLFADLTHLAIYPDSTVPAIGASGAISGVLGAYAALFPLARVLFMVPVFIFPFFFELPALIYAAFWFLLQFLQGTGGLLAPQMGGGVAWWAHIGGFVGGLLLIRGLQIARPERRYPDQGILGYAPDGRRHH